MDYGNRWSKDNPFTPCDGSNPHPMWLREAKEWEIDKVSKRINRAIKSFKKKKQIEYIPIKCYDCGKAGLTLYKIDDLEDKYRCKRCMGYDKD